MDCQNASVLQETPRTGAVSASRKPRKSLDPQIGDKQLMHLRIALIQLGTASLPLKPCVSSEGVFLNFGLYKIPL